MLEELRISGLGVIDEAVLPLDAGLTVLTGETGAGKTMLVTALLLLFGSRADSARVRTGADQATVDGRVSRLPTETIARVDAAGGRIDDGELLIRRLVTAGGRSRAVIGGAPAPVSVLAELSEGLVVVHGQSDQLRLVRPAQQLAALDQFARLDLAAYRAEFARWRDLSARLADRTMRARELRREADLLRQGVHEITAASPQPGEDVALATEANRLAHVDALRLAAQLAREAIVGDPDDPGLEPSDAANRLDQARRQLVGQSEDDPELAEIASRVTGLLADAVDVAADLSSYLNRLDADPERLAEVEARRSVLTGLIRRYGDDLDAVLAWAVDAATRLDDLDVSDDALAALAADCEEAAARCAALASELSAIRAKAAATLASAVTAELGGLAMPDATMLIRVTRRKPVAGQPTLSIEDEITAATVDGVDDVELLLQAHPDSPALPIGRGASGGELSRIMLAIEVCLADSAAAPTMIFDEVDAGVGGRAAVEVGRRLALLAKDRQVIVVTHLAQVAAFADAHLVIDKPVGQRGVTKSDVRLVAGDARVVELARMLAGSDSESARVHAAELLQSAKRDQTGRALARKSRRGVKTGS